VLMTKDSLLKSAPCDNNSAVREGRRLW